MVEESFPLTITSVHSNVDVVEWQRKHEHLLHKSLCQHGAVLLRGFDVRERASFATFVKNSCGDLIDDYGDLTSESADISDEAIYSATIYPEHQPIHFHNESAHTYHWPRYLFFYCEQAAEQGGATRVVDSQRVLNNLDPELKKHLREQRITYVRTHHLDIDTSWQAFYGTDDPCEVEILCREAGHTFHWVNRETFQTRITLPVINQHPEFNTELLFHQLFLFHPYCLDNDTRTSVQSVYDKSTLPRWVEWENGEPIDDELIQTLLRLYEDHAIDVEWQQGDVLLVDNARIAHSRQAFYGNRRILVAMGQKESYADNVFDFPKPIIDKKFLDHINVLPVEQYHSVVQRFMTWVARTPEAVAIESNQFNWTYQLLAKHVLAISAMLHAKKLAPGARVAIISGRDVYQLVGMLGSWMNSLVIVPIDNTLPLLRQRKMLEHSSAELALTTNPQFDELNGIPVVDLVTAINNPISGGDQQHLEPTTTMTPAYVFFTSGTTGQPRAVLGTHNGLAHFLNWQCNQFNIGPGDRIAQLTSPSFDVVLRDLFLPLTSGATLCLPPTDLDLSDPWRWLSRIGVTRLHTVPTLATVWLDNAGVDGGLSAAEAIDSLETIFFAGEPLTDVVVQRFRALRQDSLQVINLYGPTETTLAKCWYEVPLDVIPGVQPIGNPLPGCQILIVKQNKQICDPGETGEIVLCTPYKTLGYLASNGQLDSNADQLYFTGDLGRERQDGKFDILGRRDEQLKLMGVRIEPQEIAVVLANHPSVQQAFVTLADTTPKSLQAFVVAKATAPSTSVLGSYLAQRLPAAMLPRHYWFMEKLPVTLNGKIDRVVLANYTEQITSPNVCHAPPGTSTEIALAILWRDLLKLSDIENEPGLASDFFDLGGHSLLAIQLLSRLRASYGSSIELRHIFEYSTLQAMADFIDSTNLYQQQPETIIHEEVNDSMRLSRSQERFWFLSKLEPNSASYHIPGAVRFCGKFDFVQLKSCLDMLICRHPALRTHFFEKNGIPLQYVGKPMPFPLAQQDVSDLPIGKRETAVQKAALADLQKPFQLDCAPLARALLIRISEKEHVLTYTLHHSIGDGWSNLLFNQELQKLYVVNDLTDSSRLPKLSIDYSDYTRWEYAWLAQHGQGQLAYWREQLKDAPVRLSLPTDKTLPCVQDNSSGSCTFSLPAPLIAKLRAAWPDSGTTIFMRLLSILTLLLYRYTGENDLSIGTPVARRSLRETEGLIGCFINTLVIRTLIQEGQTFRELLEAVRDSALEAFAHQDIPFHQVVEAVDPIRDPDHHPLFQVLFNCLYFEKPETHTDELSMRREWLLDPQSKFDLAFYARVLDERIDLHLVYNANRFASQKMSDLLDDYVQLIESCIADQQTSIAPQHLVPSSAPKKVKQIEKYAVTQATAEIEPALAVIWCEVLGLQKVERDEDFFQLGGYSLLGVQLMARVEQQFCLIIPLRNLFEHPTIAGLAHCLDAAKSTAVISTITLAADPQNTDVPLSIDQHYLHQLHKEGRDGHFYNVPRVAHCSGHLDTDLLRSAFNEVIERHTVLRMLYDKNGSPQLQHNVTGTFYNIDLSMLDSVAQLYQQQELIDTEATYHFDLTKELPLRLTLVRLGQKQSLLIVVAHHICADCWSMGLPFQTVMDDDDPWHIGVFFKELMLLYDSKQRGLPSSLAPMEIQYLDYARYQHKRLAKGDYSKHADFWHKQLADVPLTIDLPTDFPRQPQLSLRGARRPFKVPDGLFSRLDLVRRECQTSLFVPLLGAFGLVLYDWAGVTDMLIGTPVANRNQPQTEDLIGLVANSLVLRIKIKEQQSITDYLHELHVMVGQSHDYQDYPFSQLIEDMQVVDSSRPPLFQVRLVLQHVPESTLNIPNLSLKPVRFDRGVSKYELSLIIAIQGKRMRGWCEYSTDLFCENTIAKFCDSYINILDNQLAELEYAT